MTDDHTKLRAVVGDNQTVVALALVACVLAGGWLAYGAYADPGESTRTVQQEAWSTTGWYNHSATVTEENDVYETGTTLDDRSTYLGRIAPRLDGSYVFQYDARQSGDLAGNVSVVLVFTGTEGGSGEEPATVHWRKERVLANDSFSSLSPGDRVQVPFSLDAIAADQRAANISEQLGSSGEPSVSIRTTVTVQGTVDGEQVTHRQTDPLSLSVDGSTYSVSGATAQTESFDEARQVAVPAQAGPLGRFGGPGLLFVGLAGLGVLAVGNRRDLFTVSEAERERLAFEGERGEFDEWISEIRLPEDAFDRPAAEAESLQALVDFAIDTDNAVVEDPDEEAFYVVHGDYLYVYRPPTETPDEPGAVAMDDTADAEEEPAGPDAGADDWPDPLEPVTTSEEPPTWDDTGQAED
ncbi:DUF5305 domain-containing protein [Haloarchaeobius amylolyticus]|uniref:DUF5305 domain-containing protein n=1 Tax=Haloarchaeobius amylolyticus TaxID=1198296 RepID=UPI00226EFB9E|nr:DUF5305 domain-containing protein [Haloarchaeobius amylolyticus]